MPIPVVCPTCNHRLSAPDAAAGRKAKCSKCGGAVIVPQASAKQTSASAEKKTLTLPAKQTSAVPTKVQHQPPALSKPAAQQTRPLAVDLRVQHEIIQTAQVSAAPTPIQATKDCPFCGEQVLAVAKKCKHCGELLDVALRAAMAAAPQVVHHAPAPAPAVHITNVNTNVVNAGAGAHKRWSPIVALFLSLLIPGLGQLYKGQLLNGVVWFIAVIAGYVFLIVPGIVLHICCMIGAASGDPYR